MITYELSKVNTGIKMNFPHFNSNLKSFKTPFLKINPAIINNNIPKIIHQLWIGEKPKPQKWLNTWKDNHPDYEYVLWDYKKLSSEKFHNQTLIDKMPELNGKADIMRYEILYKYGGFFLDADSECLQPLEPEFCNYDFIACYENEKFRGGVVSCAIMGCNPDNKLMEHCIVSLEELNLPISPAWWYVGPIFFTYVIHKNIYKNINILPSYTFIPYHYSGLKHIGDFLPYADQKWGTTLKLY